ncbi:MAG: 2-oxoglutarate dehydrogenase complex dihydrolipoyllysine-residue succinyltransferase [Phycisphaerales bacterium]
MDIVVPSPGESITEVTLGQWHRQDGDWVETDEILVDIESDKATLEVRAPAAGVLHVKAKAGAEQKVGAAIASIDTSAAKPAGGGAAKAASGAPAAAPVAAPAASAAAATEAKPEGGRKASSLARKVAADKGVDLANVAGSGTAGRIVVADVERAATGVAAIANPVKPVAPAPAPLAVAGARGTRRERMPKIRQRIAERLVQAQHTAAMLTTFNECDMTEVMRLRAEHKESFEKHHGVGLGFMSFFVKACTSALQRFPKVNAYFMGEEVEHHDYCDVSIAVGTDRGLVVPVLRNAEAMSFAEIELAIRGFAARARDGKLSVDEMSGGTFTITNGGIYGSLMSTPILNPPQSAILGMHAIKKRPVEDPRNPGQVALRPMMYLALSYDHRIIDGAEAVSFLVHVKDCIEKPERLLLD